MTDTTARLDPSEPCHRAGFGASGPSLPEGNAALAAFTALQRRAEHAGLKLRRFEGGGVERYAIRWCGTWRELHTMDDIEALVAQVSPSRRASAGTDA